MTRKEIKSLNRWTKYKKYYAGENHYQWEVKLVIYQRHSLYKFVLADDEDTTYIASNYVAPATAVKIDEIIMHKSAQCESLTDIFDVLQNTIYGRAFYLGNKIAPQQLTDGILLLSLFCKGNNFNFEVETLSNGVSRAVIEDVNLQDVEKIKENAKKSGLHAEATAYGNERDVFIYNYEGWNKMMKRFNSTTINTINDMIDVLTKAKNLLGGDAPFTVINDFGILNLVTNNNMIINNGGLVINASDWSSLDKDMDF